MACLLTAAAAAQDVTTPNSGDIDLYDPDLIEVLLADPNLDFGVFSEAARRGGADTDALGVSASGARCLEPEVLPGEIVRLSVAPFAELRLEMPFPILTVSLGGTAFWEAAYEPGSPHVWLRSRSNTPEAASTSLSVLDDSLAAWDFVLLRDPRPGYTCARIRTPAASRTLRELSGWRSPEDRDRDAADRALAELSAHYEEELSRLRQHAENALSTANASVYGGYGWRADNESPESARIAEAVLSVHDDGVNTYIRIRPGAPVDLLAVEGVYGGEPEIVQTSWDPITQMYTVLGVFNTLRLSAGAGDPPPRALIERSLPR